MNTLGKNERLSSKKDIARLLEEGRFGVTDGLKYCYAPSSGVDVNRILVSVPKKFFRRAVKRNLLKRRIRESYRTQKGLLEASGWQVINEGFNGQEIPVSQWERDHWCQRLRQADSPQTRLEKIINGGKICRRRKPRSARFALRSA